MTPTNALYPDLLKERFKTILELTPIGWQRRNNPVSLPEPCCASLCAFSVSCRLP